MADKKSQPKQEVTPVIRDAAVGKGVFTLVDHGGKHYIHYNLPQGYLLFAVRNDDALAMKINNHLADVLEAEHGKATRAATAEARDKELIEAVAQPWICVEGKPCEEAVPVHWDEMITALAAMNSHPATELTVESALRELRELVRDKYINVCQDRSFYPADCKEGSETGTVFTIKIGYLQSEPRFISTKSLSDCMDQVRAWPKSRAQKEGDGCAKV